MRNYYALFYVCKKVLIILISLILPLISAIDVPLDLVSLQSNCINLVAAAGTMATLSLVFLFERIEAASPPPRMSRLSTRVLAMISILYFLFASFAGLIYEVIGSDVIFVQILFWYTIFGIICLLFIGGIFYLSRSEVTL